MDPIITEKIKRDTKINFGLFALFFLYYVGAAALQTPMLHSVSEIRIGSIPLGLITSLGVFPVSWIVIFIWFKKAL
ncbi:MAG: hypothetical protein HUU10_09505 [Bacteroidetes bacterium]|nr:hypothetical protein [Bacteroidota bacterium]